MHKPISWHTLESFEVLEHQAVDYTKGLDSYEVARRRRKHGANRINQRRRLSPLRLFWNRVASPPVLLLWLAAGLLVYTRSLPAAAVLAGVALVNFCLETFQFQRGNRLLAALRRFHAETVRVRRGGRVQKVPADQLVPGDVILLEAGDTVAADARLIESANLRAQEALLTGEYHPVDKVPQAMTGEQVPTGGRRNLVFMGTKIVHGRGQAVVVATGMQTELGRIAQLSQPHQDEPTSLQQRLRRIEWVLAGAFLAASCLVAAFGFLHSQSPVGVAEEIATLATAATPAGLQVVLLAALAVGARRIFHNRVYVRQLPAVEALSAVTVICTDKPGTLTENQVDLTLHDVQGEEHQLIVSLSGNHPLHRSQDRPARPISPEHAMLLSCAVLSSSAEIRVSGESDEEFLTTGDPAEGAILVAAARHGLWQARLEKLFPRLVEASYTETHPRTCTVHTARLTRHLSPVEDPLAGLFTQGYAYVACVKGPVPALLKASNRVWIDGQLEPLTETRQVHLEADYARLSRDGSHVIAVAIRPLTRLPALAEDLQLPLQGFPSPFRDLPAGPADVPSDPRIGIELERDLVFLGMLRLSDAPRAEVRQAVLACRSAGIRPVMMTGDQPQAAIQAAYRLHILEGSTPQVLTGEDLRRLSPREMDEAVDKVSIFARLSSEQKLEIVEALQRRGHVVAITGTSVNEAPALRQSDIGIAMGLKGTEVSKEAAQLVVLDDSFASIVRAIAEGRQTDQNLRRYLGFTLSVSLAEVLFFLGAALLGLHNPLTPLQVLWTNLVIGLLPGLALAVRPTSKDMMHEPPAQSGQGRFGRSWWAAGWRAALVMALLTLALTWSAYSGQDPAWQTLAFTLLGVLEVSLAVTIYTHRQPWEATGSYQILAAAGLGSLLLEVIALVYPPVSAWLALPALPYRDLFIALLAGVGFFAWSEVERAVFSPPH